MCGELSVTGVCRPPVIRNKYLLAALVNHRLNCQSHAGVEPRPSARCAVIRDTGVLMKLASDAVTYKIADYRKTVILDICLDGMRDVAESFALFCMSDSLKKALLCNINQPLCFAADFPRTEGSCAVGVVAVQEYAYIDANDVAFLNDLVLARYAVDYNIVNRCAHRPRKAPVIKE